MVGKTKTLPKMSYTYPALIKLGTVILYLEKIQKYTYHMTPTCALLTSAFSHRKSTKFAI